MAKRTWMNGLGLAAILLLILGFSAVAQEDSDEGESLSDDDDIERLVVVGVRNPDRDHTLSTSSVDLVDAEVLDQNGSVDLLDALGNQIPAFHVEVFPIADAATLIRPPNMRQLPADATLVLINGKRRHRGAVITLLGGGKNAGAQGSDITPIPSISLDRVEVLGHSAAAQYGSDAIAGVMNFVLRDSADIRMFQYKVGQRYKGDGFVTSYSGVVGLPLGSSGFVTLTGEWGEASSTSRSVQRDDAIGLIVSGNDEVRQPAAQIWGSPDVHYDKRLFANAEMPFTGDTVMYGFANWSERDVEGGFFFRNPNTRSGVFTSDNGATLLVADLTPDDDFECATILVTDQRIPDPLGIAQVQADPNCHTFASQFPGGFTPQFGGIVVDQSIALGMTGTVFDAWTFDASFVWGSSAVEYYMFNTINPQLVDLKEDIPTSYKPGIHEEADTTINFDLSRSVDVASGFGPVHFATGLEIRNDTFITTQGGENSWKVNPIFAAQGFGIGSNGFPGFPPSAEVDETRSSWALWADADQDLTSNILGSVAVRYESYDDAGQTLTYKIGAFITFTDDLALRLGYGTGFIAPTVAQSNIRIVSTNFLVSPICPEPGVPCLADEITLPPTDPLAILKGSEALSPINSSDIIVGVLANWAGYDIELGYFRIIVEDRIARTSAISIDASDYDVLEARGEVVDRSLSAIRFYTNDFDTKTEGIDLTVNRAMDFGFVTSDFALSMNYTKTSVTHFNPVIINSQRVRELEDGIPNFTFRLTGNHQIGDKWTAVTRFRYYGELWEPHVFSDALPVNVEEALLFDVELQFRPDERTTMAFGFENALDTYPNENPWSGVAGAQYPITSSYGFNGGFGYFRLTLSH